MPVPQVVIVGRPNVGKSSVFNWLAGRRIAIVDPTSGVTRDRLAHLVELEGRFVELVDTGGMGAGKEDHLDAHIEQQIAMAIDSADVILFVVDVRAGLTALDEQVARRLRRVEAPVVCAANKADHDKLDAAAEEFHRFGYELVKISAQVRRGKDELLQAIRTRLPEDVPEPDAATEPEMKLAIVGRRNAGKSTFVNTLVQTERMITSQRPGTTRDSVDVGFELDGKSFVAIDTPGFRRRSSIRSELDYYSTHRAERSIRRADVVLLFFDAAEPISKVEKQLCNYIAEQYKPCVFVVNKWDLMAGRVPTEQWVHQLRDTFRTMPHVPIAFITGRTGKNAKAMLNLARALFKQACRRVPTARLNRVLRIALERNPPPLYRHRLPRIYYGTQVAVQPPTLVLFCSRPRAFSQTYRRYLLKVFRQHLPLAEVPIKLYLRPRPRGETRDELAAEP